MEIISAIGSALIILAASLLGPFFIFKLFFPWVSKGGKGGNIAALTIILLNLGLYCYWIYRILTEIDQPQTMLLVSIPVLLIILTELILLIRNKYYLLYKLCVYFTIVTFPAWNVFIIYSFAKDYGPDENAVFIIFLLLFGSFLVHCFLYFATFALYKKINQNATDSYDIKIGNISLTDKKFYETSAYEEFKKMGIEKVNGIQLLKVFLKYGFIIFLFWLYIYIIVKLIPYF